MPWTNENDQFMFYVTVKFLMPKARIVARHVLESVLVEGKRTNIKGFRVILSQDNTQWAIHAVMMADTQRD